jgi:hypothetical protein
MVHIQPSKLMVKIRPKMPIIEIQPKIIKSFIIANKSNGSHPTSKTDDENPAQK